VGKGSECARSLTLGANAWVGAHRHIQGAPGRSVDIGTAFVHCPDPGPDRMTALLVTPATSNIDPIGAFSIPVAAVGDTLKPQDVARWLCAVA
jgi:hypothetical protein